ncbi:MAG: hypothetical protein HUJ90_02600 [Bacteroidales bacterium]|nr:hypothetical protein [Bacteroidales bacterium]
MIDLSKAEALIHATYNENEYPVCHHQYVEWGKSRPFEGLRILDATPLFRNSMVKHLALVAAGAELTVGLPGGLPYDKKIAELLQECGVRVVNPQDEQEHSFDFILDCAASFIDWDVKQGIVELTRSGVPKYATQGKKVFVADSGRIKKIETSLGTGESYFRAMSQLGYSDWKGKKLVIFGSGKVGRGLLAYAKKNGARAVVVTDLESLTDFVKQQADEIISAKNKDKIANALKDAYAVVTATGVADAHSDIAESLMHSPALIGNMGVEDEFGAMLPPERVLQNKKTLNFILEEPTHLKYIDATMGLHNAGVQYLLENKECSGMIEPPQELEKKLLDITKMYGTIGNELELI